jgi:hypothetical protein
MTAATRLNRRDFRPSVPSRRWSVDRVECYRNFTVGIPPGLPRKGCQFEPRSRFARIGNARDERGRRIPPDPVRQRRARSCRTTRPRRSGRPAAPARGTRCPPTDDLRRALGPRVRRRGYGRGGRVAVSGFEQFKVTLLRPGRHGRRQRCRAYRRGGRSGRVDRGAAGPAGGVRTMTRAVHGAFGLGGPGGRPPPRPCSTRCGAQTARSRSCLQWTIGGRAAGRPPPRERPGRLARYRK